MSILDDILLGAVQGLTEFLPVSSSGHLILVREFLTPALGSGLAFDAVLHFATALAVVAYFWRDIIHLVIHATYWVTGHDAGDKEKVLIVALIVATIPAVILGLLLESLMETVFRNALLVVGTLLLGSLIMWLAEKYGAHARNQQYTDFKNDFLFERGEVWKKALTVGFFQSLALVPGMSRSGMTIAGGMLMGLSRAAAARFAFLLAVPLLLGAGTKKIIELGMSGALASSAFALTAGALSAFFIGLAVIHYLLRFLGKYSLMVFVWYRVVLAMLVFAFVMLY